MKLPLLLLIVPIFSWANITPNMLYKSIETTGVQRAVNALTQDDWMTINSGIAAGEKEWLDIVPKLAPVTDAKQAASLEDALATALTTNTIDTLKTLNTLDSTTYPFMLGSNIVCVPPFDKSKNEITDFYNRTREALLSTDEGSKCLWILEASMHEWERSLQ
ncbi:hypothetical protein [Yersinia pseudotuberculosis]|uniref:hypothetical protein n=1 Tax=Yersinia pseudotuberculosis TaxID=633 RepID=UPI0005DFC615|nr:hypothetical protein [Yersinia pseudotuberculosis]CNL05251.1 Uncharacterised protein [Yersinia pseudotuberculosis]